MVEPVSARAENDPAVNLAPIEAEVGLPQWIFGMSRYAFAADGEIAVCYSSHGIDHLGVISPGSREIREVTTPFTSITSLGATPEGVVAIAASPARGVRRCAHRLRDARRWRNRSRAPSPRLEIDSAVFSVPQAIEFATSGDRTAHALYYKPTKPRRRGAGRRGGRR